MSRLAVGLMALMVGLGPRQARADEAEIADERFREGHELLEEKRYGEACLKFEQSQQADPASGAQLALAYCQELSGLLATSFRSYLAAEELAEHEGHAERKSAAIERANSLKERLSMLTIVVPSSVAKLRGLRLTLDGAPLEQSVFGTPIPVNGGAHLIEISAPDRIAWTETVLLESERHRKTLIVPVLEVAETPPRNPVPSKRAAPSAPAKPPPPERNARAGMSTAEQVSLALGIGSLASLGLGTYFGVKAYTKNDASNSNGHCDAQGCDDQGAESRQDALDAAHASTWFFVASGVLAASSITLYFSSVSPSGSKSASSVQAGIGPASAQLSLRRSF